MPIVNVKGHEINAIIIRDSSNRRAQQFKNKILTAFKSFTLTDDDVDIELEPLAMKKAPATASWYMEGEHLNISYNMMPKFVENLYVIMKVLEIEIGQVMDDTQTMAEFVKKFAEDSDILKQRKEARKTLGLEVDCMDLNLINKTYKNMARDCHPDMPNGDTERFKVINKAHKVLNKEFS